MIPLNTPDLNKLQFEQLVLDNPFWQFSLEQWQKPALQAQLLNLQNQQDYRINLLLLAMWLGFEQRDIRPHLHTFVEASSAWHEQVVAPIRKTRQSLPAATRDLKQQLQACELQAEQIEQAILYAASVQCYPGSTTEQAAAAANKPDSLDWLIINLSASELAQSDLFLLLQTCLPSYPAQRINERLDRHRQASR